MRSIFLENGYIDFDAIYHNGCPFTFVIGGRGVGKTYGALKYIYEQKIPTLYIRRTVTQCNIISSDEFNPFKPVLEDAGKLAVMRTIKSPLSACYAADSDDDEDLKNAELVSYVAPMSTFANLRGFGARNVECMIYDEFIKEENEKGLRNEGYAFLNAYETINRNRELTGYEPVKALLFSNSENISSDIFLYMNLVTVVERMLSKARWYYVNKERGVAIYIVKNSPISQKKMDTALYRAVNGTGFAEMALNNDFRDYNSDDYVSAPLTEYSPKVAYGQLVFYKHKSRLEFYVSTGAVGKFDTVPPTPDGRAFFRHKYGAFATAYKMGICKFESAYVEQMFKNLLNIRD